MPHFEEEAKKPEPKEIWLISYADLVTLMLSFFILLFSFCKLDVEVLKAVSASFKATPPGTPFFFEGGDSSLESMASQIQTSDFGQDMYVTLDDRGVVVDLSANALFGAGSADLLPAAEQILSHFAKFLYAFSNKIAIEGHTDDQPIQTARFPSNWELSASRAGAVARWLEQNGVQSTRLEVIGYGSTRPRFRNDSPEKRSLNRRVEIILRPE
jgi:chemotaxis protein MotB